MPDSNVSLGSTEMDILRYLGDHPSLKVGDVADHFAKTTGQARTTILTIMERLRGKGYLKRKRIKGVYHYWTVIPKKDLLRNLVKTFVKTTLAGSMTPFVQYLSEEGPVSTEELHQLKQLVQDLEKSRKGKDHA